MSATPAGWRSLRPGSEHLFGVVRIDLDRHRTPALEPEEVDSLVSGTRAFSDRGQATREAERLNALNAPKGCRYVVVTLRAPGG